MGRSGGLLGRSEGGLRVVEVAAAEVQLAELVERESAVNHLPAELLGALSGLLLGHRPLARQQVDSRPVDPAVTRDRDDSVSRATALGHLRPGTGAVVILHLRAAAQRVAVDDLRGVRGQLAAGRRGHRAVQQRGRLPDPTDPGQRPGRCAHPEHLDVEIPQPASDLGGAAGQLHRAVDVTLEQQQHLTADPVEPSVFGALGFVGEEPAGGRQPSPGDRDVTSRKLVRRQGERHARRTRTVFELAVAGVGALPGPLRLVESTVRPRGLAERLQRVRGENTSGIRVRQQLVGPPPRPPAHRQACLVELRFDGLAHPDAPLRLGFRIGCRWFAR